MSNENVMGPDPELTKIMLYLPKLRDIEDIFAVRTHIVMKVYQIRKGTISYQGNTLNVEKYIIAFIYALPLLPDFFPMFVARKNYPNSQADINISKLINKTC